eukprot:scaffold50088_cov45-Attheya_sp.AAC.1
MAEVEQQAEQQSRLAPPPSAAELLCANDEEKKLYWDRSHYSSPEAQMRALAQSSTLYIGNLAFSTRTSHLRALFSTLGTVASVNMGLDRFQKTPCGFSFVEYVNRVDALQAVSCLSGSKLDGRVIRVELDAGFKPGRQYGRGKGGGQVREDRRMGIDPARTGGRSGGPRWQAPEPSRNSGDAHYGSGGKRGRDDDDNDDERPSKNPRFRDEMSDDGMD